MPFKGYFDDYYEKIFKPGIKKAGLNPLRADQILGPRPIIEDIFAQTNSAFVLLADLTTLNPNVFYEVGLAHAIGKPVCLVIDRAELERKKGVPFDLQHLRVIEYDKNHANWGEVLQEAITKSLQAVLRDPYSARPFSPQQSSMSLSQLDHFDSLVDLTLIGKLDKLLDRPEFSYLKLTLGPHGRTLIGYLAIGEQVRADDFLRGFGFSEVERNHLLQSSAMTLKFLTSITPSLAQETSSKTEGNQRRNRIAGSGRIRR